MSGQDPNNRPPVKNQFMKAAALALALGVGLTMMGEGPQDAPQAPKDSLGLPYSDFLQKVETQQVQSVLIQRQESGIIVGGELSNGGQFTTVVPATGDEDLVRKLHDNNIKFTAVPQQQPSAFPGILINLLPMFLIIGLVVWKMKQQQGGGRGLGGFGENKAKLLTQNESKVTFDDVAGIDAAKGELMQIVDFLKRPHDYARMGAKIPKGALLVGPPGTGKTLTARAVAGEAGVPFFKISGSDFVEMFVGVGASRVRKMFEEAKKNAPCIIFIDEIDAVGRHRGNGTGGGGNDEREQTLNQLLVEMDGFDGTEGIIVIAATNRPDVLDPALLRPGRFDRQVVVPNPDLKGREAILKVHMRKVPLDGTIDANTIARGTPGFSGADLANLVNEAALLAVQRKKTRVSMDEFEEARDKVMMGLENKQLVLDAKDRELTAYHEAGHAIVGLYTTPQCDPLHKVTIIPRGRALGVTMNLPTKDTVSINESQLKAKLAMMFGGREAEIAIYGKGEVTTGASGDIQQATGIARRMVTEWGMSEKLGRVRYAAEQTFPPQKNMSEKSAQDVDDEVRRLVSEAEKTAKNLLDTHKDKLHLLAKALLEYETLTGAEVAELFENGSITRQNPAIEEIKERDPATSSVPQAGRGPKPPEPT